MRIVLIYFLGVGNWFNFSRFVRCGWTAVSELKRGRRVPEVEEGSSSEEPWPRVFGVDVRTRAVPVGRQRVEVAGRVAVRLPGYGQVAVSGDGNALAGGGGIVVDALVWQPGRSGQLGEVAQQRPEDSSGPRADAVRGAHVVCACNTQHSLSLTAATNKG